MPHLELAACVITDPKGRVLLGRFPDPLGEGPVTLELPTTVLYNGAAPRMTMRKSLQQQYDLGVTPYTRLGMAEHEDMDMRFHCQLLGAHLEQAVPIDEDLLVWRSLRGCRLGSSVDVQYELGPYAAQLALKLDRAELEI